MRRRITYLIIIALAVVSCGKDLNRREAISFFADGVGYTRAMLDSAALNSANNRLRIIDVLTGFTGTATGWSAQNPYYINDTLVFRGNPVWDYGSGRIYPWTADGTHKFFSWLHYDSALGMYDTDFFGAGTSYDASSCVLTLPQKAMVKGTPLFDFLSVLP